MFLPKVKLSHELTDSRFHNIRPNFQQQNHYNILVIFIKTFEFWFSAKSISMFHPTEYLDGPFELYRKPEISRKFQVMFHQMINVNLLKCFSSIFNIKKSVKNRKNMKKHKMKNKTLENVIFLEIAHIFGRSSSTIRCHFCSWNRFFSIIYANIGQMFQKHIFRII